MQFEVDNVTAKIAKELQESMENSLQYIHDDQGKIIKKIDSFEDKVDLEELENSVNGIEKDLSVLLSTSENIERSCDDANSLLDKIVADTKKLVDYSIKNNVSEVIAPLERISSSIELLKSSEEKISDTIGNLVNKVDEISQKIELCTQTTDGLEGKFNELSENESKCLDEIAANNAKLDEMMLLLKGLVAQSNSQEKSIREIEEYLTKPGINRLFKGIGKENQHGIDE